MAAFAAGLFLAAPSGAGTVEECRRELPLFFAEGLAHKRPEPFLAAEAMHVIRKGRVFETSETMSMNIGDHRVRYRHVAVNGWGWLWACSQYVCGDESWNSAAAAHCTPMLPVDQ